MTERFTNAVLSPAVDDHGTRMLTVYSSALGRRADITLYVPEVDRADRLPLLILLHGVHGSHWNWWALGGLAASLQKLKARGDSCPFIIAMPSDGHWGSGTAYVPHTSFNAEAWIIDDVPAAVKSVLPNVDTTRLYLAGLSMGGYGAIRLGMKYADRVTGVSAHSSVTRIEQLVDHVQEPLSEFLYSGAENVDIMHWVRQNREQIPSLRFDCGREDSLLEGNRALHEALITAGVEHVYEEFDGGHTWDFWSAHLLHTLRFMSALAAQRRTD
ncbi:MAG: alpha/beta hydrolase-fold protein [Terracidiphilus sp.]